MAIVEIRHVRRRYTRGDKEGVEIAGAIAVRGQAGSVPAGSFSLRHVDQIILGPVTGNAVGTPGAALRGLAGSVRTPNGVYANSVRFRAFISGTTGTRTTSGPSVIGSVPLSGSVSAPFVVFGQ